MVERHPHAPNAILGPQFQHLHGEPYVVDTRANARLFTPPGAFGQSTLDLACSSPLASEHFAPPGRPRDGFYAGVGADRARLAAPLRFCI